MKNYILPCIVILFCIVLYSCHANSPNVPLSPSEPTSSEPMVEPTEPTEPTEPPTQPTEPPTEPPTPQNKVHTLSFVGDCVLGTMPEWMSYAKSFTSVVKKNYEYPFAGVIQYFKEDDCTFINFEGVLANDGQPEEKQFTFRGPTDYIHILTGSDVEVANLSNNHSFDFGQPGYNSTTQLMKDNGIQYIERQGTSLYTTKSGITIGMYGVYFDLNEKDMRQDVQMLKQAGADIIVAAAHWGIEREYSPSTKQVSIAHKLIDAGVDIVWGHHPHVLQPIEFYKNGVIYYSLGNFSFGGNHNPSDKDTALLQQQIIEHPDGSITLGELLVVPCRLSSVTYKNDFQPTPYAYDDAGYQRVLDKLKYHSQP